MIDDAVFRYLLVGVVLAMLLIVFWSIRVQFFGGRDLGAILARLRGDD
jgi:hypothetical protein